MKRKLKNKLDNKIIKILRSSSTKLNFKEITKKLNLKTKKDLKMTKKKLRNLKERGILTFKLSKYSFVKKGYEKIKKGYLEIVRSGTGFLITPEDEKDIKINRKNLLNALHNDLVKVKVINKNGKITGDIIEVEKRDKTIYPVIINEKNKIILKSGGRNVECILKNNNDYEKINNKRFTIKIEKWKPNESKPYVVINEILGDIGEINTEIKSIIIENKIKNVFPKEVIKEVNLIREIKEAEEKREDYSKELTFTIDPDSAKDFDDALSFKELDKEIFEIGVHIADVSSYVKPGTELDKEAKKRGTSVYLANTVVPMLPEKLSNEICSLEPKKKKKTFSVIFRIDKEGNILKERATRSTIYSDCRFTYSDVQSIIEEGKKTNKKYKKFEKPIKKLNEISKKIRKNRRERGAIFFNKKEIGFIFRGEKIQGTYLKENKESHNLVEEFMLLTNIAVAEKLKTKKAIFRVHDIPDRKKVENLFSIAQSFGYKKINKKENIGIQINNLLSQSKEKKESNIINLLALRSMSKAEYSTNNIGHHGLSLPHYLHFTSPIRRYPDIICHRLLNSFLIKEETPINIDEMNKISSISTRKEKSATKAERETIKLLQTAFMKDKQGKKFNGVISGVTERGIYVEMEKNYCEGFIEISKLQNDYFVFDIEKHRLVGELTNKIYQLGDSLNVIVEKADIIKREISLKIKN
ncbi:MAG: ribonuclease R [Flavobacteriaceae bacterium TMED200]|nr:MAG: ribonuclease R [Flavobacteriaceae bacterium TMED200]